VVTRVVMSLLGPVGPGRSIACGAWRTRRSPEEPKIPDRRSPSGRPGLRSPQWSPGRHGWPPRALVGPPGKRPAGEPRLGSDKQSEAQPRSRDRKPPGRGVTRRNKTRTVSARNARMIAPRPSLLVFARPPALCGSGGASLTGFSRATHAWDRISAGTPAHAVTAVTAVPAP
jgi:hypothetical protein